MDDQLADNLRRVNADIAAACARVGRSPNEVTLVAVTKSADLVWVRRLIALGVHDLGENRPQQLLERVETLSDDEKDEKGDRSNFGRSALGSSERVVPKLDLSPFSSVRWHLVGHLQRNKVRPVLPRTVLVHSVDSLRLLERISTLAAELSLTPRVLLEVNVSGEASKDGLSIAELTADWEAFVAVPHVEIVGLMAMAPLSADPAAARPVFRALRHLRDDLAARAASRLKLTELSMGMSDDFPIAVEEGATLVRIGRRLFEGLS